MSKAAEVKSSTALAPDFDAPAPDVNTYLVQLPDDQIANQVEEIIDNNFDMDALRHIAGRVPQKDRERFFREGLRQAMVCIVEGFDRLAALNLFAGLCKINIGRKILAESFDDFATSVETSHRSTPQDVMKFFDNRLAAVSEIVFAHFFVGDFDKKASEQQVEKSILSSSEKPPEKDSMNLLFNKIFEDHKGEIVKAAAVKIVLAKANDLTMEQSFNVGLLLLRGEKHIQAVLMSDAQFSNALANLVTQYLYGVPDKNLPRVVDADLTDARRQTMHQIYIEPSSIPKWTSVRFRAAYKELEEQAGERKSDKGRSNPGEVRKKPEGVAGAQTASKPGTSPDAISVSPVVEQEEVNEQQAA
jgi:hypothetical protein